MKRIQVGLEEETLSRVDERRGLVARERFLRAAVEHYLDCDRLAVPVRATKGGGTSSKPPPTDPAPKERPKERPVAEHQRHRPVRDASGRWVCKDGGEFLQMGPSGL